MRQIWIPRFGAPDVLEVREEDDPTAGAGEVRIRVDAAGINFADIMARMGLYQDAPPPPMVVGYEVAGVVDEIGPGVDDLSVGDRVLCLTRFGGYADVVVAPRIQVAKLPDTLSSEIAAGIPVNYLTAYLMLVELGNVQAKHTVLVHAAAGGVGQAALALCKDVGATVVGTASAPKHERLRELGAAHCIDYRSEDFEQEVMTFTKNQGVDIVLDAVGGTSFRKSYRCLAPMGRLFMFGASSIATGKTRNLLTAVGGVMRMPWFRPITMMNDNKGVFGVNLGHLWERSDALADMLGSVLAKVNAGALEPTVDRSFGFDEAAEAHRYIQDRKNFGKVVLTP